MTSVVQFVSSQVHNFANINSGRSFQSFLFTDTGLVAVTCIIACSILLHLLSAAYCSRGIIKRHRIRRRLTRGCFVLIFEEFQNRNSRMFNVRIHNLRMSDHVSFLFLVSVHSNCVPVCAYRLPCRAWLCIYHRSSSTLLEPVLLHTNDRSSAEKRRTCCSAYVSVCACVRWWLLSILLLPLVSCGRMCVPDANTQTHTRTYVWGKKKKRVYRFAAHNALRALSAREETWQTHRRTRAHVRSHTCM